MTISLISTVRINKEQKRPQIGADLDITISLISTVRLNKGAPSGADLDMTISLISS